MVLKRYVYISFFIILFIFFNLSSVKAVTFPEYLQYLGNQDLTSHQQTAYNYFYQTYYNSSVDFTDLLTTWQDTDTIYTIQFSHSNSSPFVLQVSFFNVKNTFMYKDGNNIRFGSSVETTHISYSMSNDKTKINAGNPSISNRTFYNVGSDFFQENATSPRFIISESPLYQEQNATNIYTGFYWFNDIISPFGFTYESNPIYANYQQNLIKLGTFTGGVDYSDVTIQFGFLNQDNTMGQILATYGYYDSPVLNKLVINNNNLFIPSRLITSDTYAISVVIGTTAFDKVLDIEFVSASGTSGDSVFNIQDSTNNIIDNDNNNTDKIINSITKPYAPSGDYNISSGDFDLGITYTNPFNNLISEIINLLRVSLTSSQRSVNLGFLPILNDDYIVNLDTNFKCPYNTETKIFIGTMINGAMLIGVIYFIISIIHNLTTGNLKNLAYEFNEEGEFFNWF